MPLRVMLWGIVACTWLSPDVPAAEGPQYRRLTAVPFTEVKLDDVFWAPRIRTNRQQSLPHNFQWCEQTGRIGNFAKAGKLMPGKFEGIYFNDSDVFKVLEGASYSLADSPDPALAKTVDDVIAKIASAQQPDGYLNSYYTLAEPGKRWTNLEAMHELYCAGHMIEGAVAHFRATGKRTFLDVAIRYADHIDSIFGPGKRYGVCGHEEIELALVKLYQVTGRRKYLDLARFFLDVRGDASKRKLFGAGLQDHIPVRQQRAIVGHAVRAMYLYTAVADVAGYTGDRGFLETMDAIWNDVVRKKLYITGGVGARHDGEAFGNAYELPNDSAYCETCAAIGLVFWAHRLNLLHGDAQYMDVLEQALYNGVLSGIGLDGKTFFYVNPLASGGGHHRQPFFGCACCPSNVVRLVPSVPGYVYAVDSEGLTVNLYAAGKANVALAAGKAGKVRLVQETRYPWDGRVVLTLSPERAAEFDVRLRIPAWADKAGLAVNDQAVAAPEIRKGYARLRRTWQPGDRITLDLPMPVRRIEAHPAVKDDAGRVAIQRGPIVYCFEAVDNSVSVRNIVLSRDPQFAVRPRADLLGGVSVVAAHDRRGREAIAVPYYAWDHRKPGEMVVWVRQDGKARTPPVDAAWSGKLYRALDPATLGPSEPPKLADRITASASHRDNVGGTLASLFDGIDPKDSCDLTIPRFSWWDHRGTQEWVQYDFDEPQKVSSVEVYWFDDAPIKADCRVPKSWRLVYREGGQWKPVRARGPFGAAIDKFNRVDFEPVATGALRLEVRLADGWSGGMLEWKVR
jgi:DUF1680 family protein